MQSWNTKNFTVKREILAWIKKKNYTW
jgi:hypothetical protein